MRTRLKVVLPGSPIERASEHPRLHQLARWGAGVPVAIGFVVLSGWALDISLFKSVLPGLAAMQPMTAGGMIVGGAGLAWLNPADDRETGWGAFLSLVAGIVLTVLSTAVLNEYVWNTDLLIDWLLFPDAIARWPIAHPGRMAPSTAFTFLLAGLCLLSARLPSFRPRLYNLFASTGLVIPAMGLMGYAYSVDALYSFGPFKTMALHTAVSFFFLFIGLLAARPHWSWVHFLTAGDFGSMVVRRLVPFAIGVPLVVGWVMLQASRLTGMHPDFRLVVVALVAAGMLLLAAIWSTRQLSGWKPACEPAKSALYLPMKPPGRGRGTGISVPATSSGPKPAAGFTGMTIRRRQPISVPGRIVFMPKTATVSKRRSVVS
jgi:hypothetical protein